MNSAPSSYFALLKEPQVTSIFAWAALARLQYGVIPLVMLLLIASQRQSYGEAASAAAAYGLSAGLLGPFRARLADRCGHTRTLSVLALMNAAGLVGLSTLTTAPLAMLVTVAALAGCCAPPVGPVMRSTWRVLAVGEGQLQAAFSLDSVSEEVLFVLGPLIAAAAVSNIDARVVLAVSVLVHTVSVGGMSAALRRAPSAPAHPAAGGNNTQLWRSTRFLAGLVPAVAIGFLLAGFEIAAIAAVLRTASEGFAGLPAALISAGSIVGGLVYGRRAWPGSARVHALTCVLVSSGVVALCAAVSGSLAPMLVLFVIAGVFVAPSIVASYLVADAVTVAATAEATSWVNSAFNVGVAVGTLVAGLLVDASGPSLAMVVAAVVAVALAVSSLFRDRHRRWPPLTPDQPVYPRV